MSRPVGTKNKKPYTRRRPPRQPTVRQTPRPNRLTELRERPIVLTQTQVAKLLNTDTSTVSRDESGDRPITKARILLYAQLYCVPSHEIFFAAEEE